MHSSRMSNGHLLTISCSAWGFCPSPPGSRPPSRCRPPEWRPSRYRPSLDVDPPCHVTCDACWEANPPVNRMTHRCKNITFPQTSFAGGKNFIFWKGTLADDENIFEDVLLSRLWLCNKTPADNPEPQQLRYVNLVPKCTASGGLMKPEFENFISTIERFNGQIANEPIQGRFCYELQYHHFLQRVSYCLVRFFIKSDSH